MRRLTFTNARGESVILGNSGPFLLTKLEGTGGVSADIQTQKSPFQDGVTYIDNFLEPRSITIEGAILKHTRAEIFECRRKLSSVFNSKLGLGTLKYEYDGGVKIIEAIADGAPVFPDRSGRPVQMFLINLLCPNPFWLAPLEQIIKLEDFVANFRFPFHFPVVFSVRGDTRTIINDGDVPTPITVEFRGYAINPRVTNVTTGEFIQVNREIPENYSLVIDTEFGKKRVSIIAPDGVETNAFHYIDLESTFFDLEVGENQLSFITSGGSPEVYVHFKKRYVGV